MSWGSGTNRKGGKLPSTSPAWKVRTLLEDGGSGSGLDLEDHLLFCQMDFLCHFEGGEVGWKEAARWLKYEEKVEPGGRWSRPHMAAASLHALEHVRHALAEHPVLFEVASDYDDIDMVMDAYADAICAKLRLSQAKRQIVHTALVSPHKHAHRKKYKPEPDKKTFSKGPFGGLEEVCPFLPRSEYRDIQEMALIEEEEPANDKKRILPALKSYGTINEEFHSRDPDRYYLTYPNGMTPSTLEPYTLNKRLMRKIPTGTETANILVGKLDAITSPVMVFGRLKRSELLLDMTEITVPTRFIVVILAPTDDISIFEHGEVGRAMAALFTDRVFCEVAYRATSREELLSGIDEYTEELTILPPSIWDPLARLEPPDQKRSFEKVKKRLTNERPASRVPPTKKEEEDSELDPSLLRTGRPFGGIMADIRRKLPWYKSDFTDGFHIQCLATIVYIFFAHITPSVTFGGVLSIVTEHNIGVMETILGTTLCGLLYHLFAGQPLTILGATGPSLVFEGLLYQICLLYDIDYLSFRFWIGMWVMLILTLVAIFDMSFVIRYITRFTQESFALLIALIFIIKAFLELCNVWDTHPVHVNTQDTFGVLTCHCVNPDPSANETSVDEYTQVSNLTWDTLISRDCVTWTGRLIVSPLCIETERCEQFGWDLVGAGCKIHEIVNASPDIFLLSAILFLISFSVSYAFRALRGSHYFSSKIRNTLADFGVPIAILIATVVDYVIGLNTPKLNVPSDFKTTIPGRGWLVNPMAITYWWLILVSAIPATLASILFFLDQQITTVIINRKDNKFKKGHGYHLDLLVVALPIGICTVFGLPWIMAATLRSIVHVRSLIIISEARAPGEKASFLGTREQRMTGVVVHILLGISVFSTEFLKHIPMPVLYGVFFYMGVCAMSGLQFVDRMLLFIIPAKYHPDYPYLRHVALSRVHVFTFIQFLAIVAMWVCKEVDVISIGFPLMLVVVSVIRKLMEYGYTEKELYWLDDLFPSENVDKKADVEEVFSIYAPPESQKQRKRHLSYDWVDDTDMEMHMEELKRRSTEHLNVLAGTRSLGGSPRSTRSRRFRSSANMFEKTQSDVE